MNLTIISYEFGFEAAHRLPNVPSTHKCSRLHGHSYKVEVGVEGPVDPTMGWICDFSVLKDIWAPLNDALDHRYLNEIPGLQNPTSENLAHFIMTEFSAALQKRVPGAAVSLVRVKETCQSACVIVRQA